MNRKQYEAMMKDEEAAELAQERADLRAYPKTAAESHALERAKVERPTREEFRREELRNEAMQERDAAAKERAR